MDQVEKLFCNSLQKKSIQVKNDFSQQLPTIEASESQILIAFQKIFDNAIKFNQVEGLISVRTDRKDDMIFVIIEDTGIGINEKYLNKIFDMFFQVDRRTLEQQGLGLGLAIAKKYIELNQGSIAVESIPGEGTRFTITFKC